jgi:Tfp pilus assembly protein PilO
MIKLIGILLLISAGVVVLTYNGLFKDEDKDGIPDAIEDKAKKVKEKIKKKIKKR